MNTYTMIDATIFISDIERAESKLIELNRKAVRMALPEVTMKVMDKRMIEYKDDITGDVLFVRPQYEIIVTGPVLKVGDWELVGKLDHIEGLNKAAPGKSIPQEFFGADPICEHCNTNRERNNTFILVNVEGEYKQVGGNCLGYYLGIDPAIALRMAGWTAITLSEFLEDDELSFGSGSGPTFWKLDTFMSNVVMVVNKYGWVSRERSGWGTTATVERVEAILFDRVKRYGDMKECKNEIPTAEQKETAKKVIEWMKAVEHEGNDYLYNLHQIAENDFVTPKSSGIAASAFAAYGRAIERQREAEQSNWVGTPGQKKFTFTGTVVSAHASDSPYGWNYYNTFVDSDGNQIVWKTSEPLEIGATYIVVGTIKKGDKAHTEFRGKKQTNIERCKVEMVRSPDTEEHETNEPAFVHAVS